MNWLKRWRGEKMGKPNIRFKGYTEDWEQRKLGDVAEYRNGKAHENEIDDDGEYIVVNSKFVSTNGEIKKFSNAQNEPLYENEIAFVLSDVPNGRAIARTFLIEKSGKYTLNQRIAGITPHEDTDPYYLHIKMNRNAYFLKFDDGNKQTNLSIKDVLNYEDMYPNYKEQQKIGNYFRSLDHLITLHQRKYDETKKLKKCMLQKMFPKEGEKVPEIRFSGFTGDWKQRKLGEIVNRITRKNSKLISELPLTISAQQGLIDQNEFFDKRVASKDVSGYYLIKNGEFAYNKSTSNDAPWGAIKRLDRYENGVLSTLYIVFEIKDETLVNSDFLVAYYSTNLWYKGIHEIAAEGARNHGLLNIAPTDFFKTKLKLPADIEEQQEIGEYFKKIDSLITFHHRKSNLFNKTCRNAWEQRKLGDFGKATGGTSIESEFSEDGIYKVISIGSYSENSVYNDQGIRAIKSDKTSNRVLNRNDLTMILNDKTTSGNIIGRVLLIEESGIYVYNQRTERIEINLDEYDPVFLYEMLNAPNIREKIIKQAQGNTQIYVNWTAISLLEYMIPSKEEQVKIGEYLHSISNLITLHQQKCKQLQIIRKFMLQNIFL